MPPLNSRHRQVLEHVIANPGTTAKQTAERLGLVRTTAGALLRALEKEEHLRGELIGGGELAYQATDRGRAWHTGHDRPTSPRRRPASRPVSRGERATLA